MSVNDEVEAAATDSFWDIDQFRRTVKRVDDGLHMCQELSRMIAERAEIEHDYAKKLQTWSKKWNETIEKGSVLCTQDFLTILYVQRFLHLNQYIVYFYVIAI